MSSTQKKKEPVSYEEHIRKFIYFLVIYKLQMNTNYLNDYI